MKVGPFEIPARTWIPAPPSPALPHYIGELAELARLLHGLPWLLAGGLTIPLTLGQVHRRHRDVDILVPEHELPRVETAMRGGGYSLVNSFPMAFFSVRFSLLVHTHAGSMLARLRPRWLKFRKPTSRGQPRPLDAIVDVFTFQLTEQWLETCDHGRRLRRTAPLVGHRVPLAGGHEIPCLHLHYVAELKRGRRGVVHAQDLAVLREALTAAAGA